MERAERLGRERIDMETGETKIENRQMGEELRLEWTDGGVNGKRMGSEPRDLPGEQREWK